MDHRYFILSVFFLLTFHGTGVSQGICPKPLLEDAFIVSVEGRFVNQENSRTSIDFIWNHSPIQPDSFSITVSNQHSFLLVTHPDYRYLIFLSQNVKRPLATHHLKESIGNTPLRWDDLDLMANGLFLCPDTNKSSLSFSTAFSQMWYSIKFNTKEQPSIIEMRGFQKEVRKIQIQKWKEFDGVLLPSVIQIQDSRSHGTLWIRTAYKKTSRFTDPLLQKIESKSLMSIKRWEGKVPLILQLD